MEQNSQQYHNQMVLSTWLKRLATCEIPFENTSKIVPFEIACVYDYTSEREIYCPFLGQVNEQGRTTMMTFINQSIAHNCDFAYTAPYHWLKKLYDIELQNEDDFEFFQSQSIINYITVFMNKMICFSDEFILYHDKISKEGPNQVVDELTCIFNYICLMIEETGIEDISQQLTIAMSIIDSFFNYFEVPRQPDITFMACDRVRHLRREDKLNQELKLDEEIWGELNDLDLSL